jgi:hypothetical protein
MREKAASFGPSQETCLKEFFDDSSDEREWRRFGQELFPDGNYRKPQTRVSFVASEAFVFSDPGSDR